MAARVGWLLPRARQVFALLRLHLLHIPGRWLEAPAANCYFSTFYDDTKMPLYRVHTCIFKNACYGKGEPYLIGLNYHKILYPSLLLYGSTLQEKR